jgi:hypothetical protein
MIVKAFLFVGFMRVLSRALVRETLVCSHFCLFASKSWNIHLIHSLPSPGAARSWILQFVQRPSNAGGGSRTDETRPGNDEPETCLRTLFEIGSKIQEQEEQFQNYTKHDTVVVGSSGIHRPCWNWKDPLDGRDLTVFFSTVSILQSSIQVLLTSVTLRINITTLQQKNHVVVVGAAAAAAAATAAGQ